MARDRGDIVASVVDAVLDLSSNAAGEASRAGDTAAANDDFDGESGGVLLGLPPRVWRSAVEHTGDPLLQLPRRAAAGPGSFWVSWEDGDDNSSDGTPILLLFRGSREWCDSARSAVETAIGWRSLGSAVVSAAVGHTAPPPSAVLHASGSCAAWEQQDNEEEEGPRTPNGSDVLVRTSDGRTVRADPFPETARVGGDRPRVYFVPSLGQLRQWRSGFDGLEEA